MANIKFNLKNYSKNNTPSLAQKIGDISLAVGAIGTAILAIPMATPVILPATLISVAGWLMGVGTIGKTVSKCFGFHEDPDRKLVD